jgi:O-antigen ligase
MICAVTAAAIAVSLAVPLGMMAASVAAMVFGLFCLLSGRWRWEARESPLAAINAGFAVYALGTMALVAFHGEGLPACEMLLPFLGAGLLGIGLRMTALPSALVPASLACACIGAAIGGVAMVAAAGRMHRVEFLGVGTTLGAMGAVYALLCARFLAWPAFDGRRWLKALLVCGAAGGVVVSFLSGTKGSWLLLALGAPFALWPAVRRCGAAGRAAVLLGIAAAVGAALLLPNSPVLPRARELLRDGDQFRKAYWTEAVRAAREAPWVGVGREELASRLDRAALSVRPYAPHERPPREAHNEYLDTAAARGAAGLVFLAPAFLVPLGVFLHLRRRGPEARAAADTGILLVLVFAAAGITDALFMLNAKRMTYLFLVLHLAVTATAPAPTPRPSA